MTCPSSDKWKDHCWLPNRWETYNGSSKHWKAHCHENPESKYIRRIIAQCPTKGLLSFCETHALIINRAMVGPYMNRQLPSIKFRPNQKLWDNLEFDGVYFIK